MSQTKSNINLNRPLTDRERQIIQQQFALAIRRSIYAQVYSNITSPIYEMIGKMRTSIKSGDIVFK